MSHDVNSAPKGFLFFLKWKPLVVLNNKFSIEARLRLLFAYFSSGSAQSYERIGAHEGVEEDGDVACAWRSRED